VEVIAERILREASVLSGVDDRILQRLAQRGTRRMYRPGDVMMRQGDRVSSLYVVLRGRVTISRAEGGKVTTLGEVGRGGFFGEMALIEEQPSTATVTALEPTECLLIVAWQFTALMHEYPSVTEALLRELIRRIHRERHIVF
jgi:CRP/FNR family transcriptional regulator, cyclic AMP receptor protein